MKSMTVCIGVSLFFGILAASAIAQEQTSPQNEGGMRAAESATRKATVEDIDYENRMVTLKGENGNIFTVRVGDEVKNFNQIKKGDHVTARYTESLAVGLRKPDEPPTASEQQSLSTAKPGEKPSATSTRKSQITATVGNIDRDKREVTLKGPRGNSRTLKVGKDVEAFDKLKEGDQVVATYIEEFHIAVSSPQE